ncbi:hypothetical protein FDECE_7496, partial [Fusarium decemcellulare]
YETEPLVIGADETEVVQRAAKALNIGQGKDLEEIAAEDEVTHCEIVWCTLSDSSLPLHVVEYMLWSPFNFNLFILIASILVS